MINYDVNLWAVLVAAVVSFIVGFIYYMPAVFGGLFMKYSGKSPEEQEKPSLGKIVLALIPNIIYAWIFAVLIVSLSVTSWSVVFCLGFLIWLLPTVMYFGEVLWSGISPKLFALNVAHNLLMTWIMGAILLVM
jgi:hypothetical protein